MENGRWPKALCWAGASAFVLVETFGEKAFGALSRIVPRERERGVR